MANKHTYQEICIVNHGDHFTVAVDGYALKKREYLAYPIGSVILWNIIKKHFDALWYLFTKDKNLEVI
jgi:hypothetical protein